MSQTAQQPGGEGFPREEFEAVCSHAIGLIDQNREYLQMHLRESADQPARQALADMALETAHLERVLGEMMDWMALEEPYGSMPSVRCFDLCGILQQVKGMQEEISRQVGVRLVVEMVPGPCSVLGNPGEAELLLFHLLSNALRATGAGGEICLSLYRVGNTWQLTVEDNGCGLPGQANWQENRRRFLGGAKVGLKICRAVCRRAGWDFALEECPGGGAVARIHIPAQPDTAALDGTVSLHTPGGEAQNRLRWQLARELRLLAENAE